MTLFKKTLRTLGILAATAFVIAIGTSAAHAKDDGGKHVDRMVARMEKELTLTKEQATKIRAILAKDTGAMPKRGEWQKRKECEGSEDCGGGGGEKHGGRGMGILGGDSEFNKQLRSATVDTDALNRAFAQRIDSMQTRMKKHHANRVATFVEIHAVLTPEQRAKAAANAEKRQAEWDKKHDKKHEEKHNEKHKK